MASLLPAALQLPCLHRPMPALPPSQCKLRGCSVAAPDQQSTRNWGNRQCATHAASATLELAMQAPAKRAIRPRKPKRPPMLEDRVSIMPGVGPKYEQLLQAHNIRTVSDLMQRHMEAHAGQMELTQRFLREQVGINNAGCIRSISSYMQQRQEEMQAAASSMSAEGTPSWLQPKVTLSVEGNISAGKSTFLKILEGKGLLNTKLQVVPEPVDKWQNVGKGNVNLLLEFYKAPERFAYTFQNYVFLTRMIQERESYTAGAMCRLLERSVFSDKMVFVRSVHSAKYISDTELDIYNSWFDPVLSTLPTLVPNGFIYLRATPQTCHKRLQKRGRHEESSVKLDYLQDLHSKHEDWLVDGGEALASSPTSNKYIWVEPSNQVLTHASAVPSQSATGGLLQPGLSFSIRNHLPDMSPSQQQLVAAARLPPIPPALDRAIRFLDTSKGEHMHPLLHTIPALVLDCDADVDVERDETYKQHVANQVSLYCDYVKRYMECRAHAILDQEHKSSSLLQSAPQSSIHLPGGLSNASGVRFPPAGTFNGYTLDVKGTTLYLDKQASYVAYASQGAQQAASAAAQGVDVRSLAQEQGQAAGAGARLAALSMYGTTAVRTEQAPPKQVHAGRS